MTSATINNWSEANQRYLMARLAMVTKALKRRAAKAFKNQDENVREDSQLEQALDEALRTLPATAALDTLSRAFVLSQFERDVLLLCAGPELDSEFSALCALAQADSKRPFPTFSLALATLPEAHWSAVTPAAPLRRWRLIEVSVGESLTTSPLRIDERVLHYLTGISYLDERLRGLVEFQPPPEELPLSHQALAERIASLWKQAEPNAWPVIQLSGDKRAGKRSVAAQACRALEMQLHVLRAAEVPATVAERDALARLWEREAVLNQGALLVDCDDGENLRPALSFLGQTRCPMLVASRDPLPLHQRPVTRLEIKKPGVAERQQLWRHALGPLASQLNTSLEMVASQFEFGSEEIRAASAQVLSSAPPNSDEIAPRLWDACRTSARTRLDDLAQRLEPAARWDDLVLAQSQLETLRTIAVQVNQRAKVYERWGFASKGTRGLGISALFAGASGTGKTMAAEVLAHDLQLDLYRIDLSQVVSKYIGETEKNLRRVFDAAEESGAVLLFDEADALFGKRSEVKDSHDRYANIEISYLLQRMEAYRGLAILTTNMKSVLDAAFLRRIRFIVQFPFPDCAQRASIWQRVFPGDTPTENLDIHKLARLNITGGYIRNIALHAAFFAAHAGEPVRMGHLLHAARTEYIKLEKPLTESESKGWL